MVLVWWYTSDIESLLLSYANHLVAVIDSSSFWASMISSALVSGSLDHSADFFRISPRQNKSYISTNN